MTSIAFFCAKRSSSAASAAATTRKNRRKSSVGNSISRHRGEDGGRAVLSGDGSGGKPRTVARRRQRVALLGSAANVFASRPPTPQYLRSGLLWGAGGQGRRA